MKHLRITATPDPALVPPFYSTIANSSGITETRVIDWNLAAEDVATLLYAIDGEAELFREAALETAGVDAVALSDVEESLSYALVDTRPNAIPFFSTVVTAMARAGLIVRKPLVYRDGKSYGHVVGEPGPLQAMLDEAPDEIDIRIEEIGRFPCDEVDQSTRLSDRQREAVETALAMGYYDQPRGTTHADIAAELGCAPNTVTEHLQKAEAKLVRAGIHDHDRREH